MPGGPAEVHSRSGIGPHCSLLLVLDYGTGLSLLRYSTLGKETEYGEERYRASCSVHDLVVVYDQLI